MNIPADSTKKLSTPFYRLFLLTACSAFAISPTRAGDCSKPGLDETRTFSYKGIDYIITYSDTPGDSDHDELFVHWTNPYSRDSDDYGFNDKLESLLGSDPNNPLSLPDIGIDIVTNDTVSEISFNTAAGITYRLHTRSELTSRVRDWQVAADPIDGTGARETVVLPLANDRDFYGISYQLAPAP